jgi:hypothetical protein
LKKGFATYFFYGRPEVPRNCYELGYHTIDSLSLSYPDTTIWIEGAIDKVSSIKRPNIRSFSYLPYKKTGDLYRDCGIVLTFMATPHPSYPPLQAMGCGSVPISTINEFNNWALKDGFNARVVHPTPRNIEITYKELIESPERFLTLSQNAIASAKNLDWNTELERVLSLIIKELRWE